MAITEYKYLTAEQRAHFLQRGWVRIENGVPPENVARFLENVWVRLGYDPDEKTTWEKEKIHMPRHREVPTPEFMPKAWGAICELLGGEDRIDKTLFESCGDSLIVNLGKDEYRDVSWLPGGTFAGFSDNRRCSSISHPKDLGNWHIFMTILSVFENSDGDWFTHFLDSGDQALELLVLYNDIVPKAGATWIAPDGLKNVVDFLYEHREGVNEMPQDPDGSRSICSIQTCQDFIELIGKAGDVILMHPFMPHSASKNQLRIPRFITNPPVTLKGPLNLNRENPVDYVRSDRSIDTFFCAADVSLESLVEQKILDTLGVSRLEEWHITGERRRFAPQTRAGKDALIREEVERLKAHAIRTGGTVDSMHINGPVPYAVVVR
ncbi:hypothetical protein EWM64_g9911 [Hericium alpestre]|uniref:Uncharacterized protein n=1 Tax=Hericium alpestre TaxID=135208 RepID=A0A4Y9ZJR9_9AGAM|nr:hypothetical protein EWM64_g9911 [Hericium alpestre]